MRHYPDIDQLLEEISTSVQAVAALTGPHDGQITPYRARALAINPRLWTDGEQTHHAGCSPCQRTVRAAAQALEHPGTWSLLRWKLGLLGEDERLAVRYHVEDEGCVHCHERLVARLPAAIQAGAAQVVREGKRLGSAAATQAAGLVEAVVPSVAPLPNARAVSAAGDGAPLELRAFSGDEPPLEIVARANDTAFTVSAFTTNQMLPNLLSYALLDPTGTRQLDGHLLLGAGTGGRRGQVILPAAEVFAALGGALDRVLVCTVTPNQIGAEDRMGLLAAVARATDPSKRADWAAWAANSLAPDLPADARAAVEAVAAVLRDGDADRAATVD